jgi:hypothetical protein
MRVKRSSRQSRVTESGPGAPLRIVNNERQDVAQHLRAGVIEKMGVIDDEDHTIARTSLERMTDGAVQGERRGARLKVFGRDEAQQRTEWQRVRGSGSDNRLDSETISTHMGCGVVREPRLPNTRSTSEHNTAGLSTTEELKYECQLLIATDQRRGRQLN